MMAAVGAEDRFRAIFRAAHAGHTACHDDEWLTEPCRDLDGGTPPPLVWSRRNGPWRPVDVVWVGAAPGNAGGLGSGALGAHGTRIPFGGDIAGGNLDVLLAAAGLDRNETFIVASLNRLPERGGGEPSTREIGAPVGRYPDSVALLRDTLVATRPRLVVALGNVALRVLMAAVQREYDAGVGAPAAVAGPLRLPGPARVAAAGFVRGRCIPWPEDAAPVARSFMAAWTATWPDTTLPHVLPVLHPSAQNMSPFAGVDTVFHRRMLVTRDAVGHAVRQRFGRHAPAIRPPLPTHGIYALPEWRELIAPVHRRHDLLWRSRGV